MKSMRLLAATMIGMLGLAGCGDGIQSPDFTAVLEKLELRSDAPQDSAPGAGSRRALPAGRPGSLDVIATATNPPGSESRTSEGEFDDANFNLSPDGVATVENGALVGTMVGGIVTVTASKDGVESNPITFRIVPPVLSSIDIAPPSATISVFETATFLATATFSDGTSNVPLVVNWTVDPRTPGVVTLSTASGQRTTATPLAGTEGRTAIIVAKTMADDGNGGMAMFMDTATVMINNEMLSSLDAITPANPTVAPGGMVDFTARGTFTTTGASGPSTRMGDIADRFVTWTSAEPGKATIDADGRATGVAPGGRETVITATLTAATAPAATPRMASTVLAITDARCLTPLLDQLGATASSEITPDCTSCSVVNTGGAIDGDVSTFASISVSAGGNATATLNADTNAADLPAGMRTGFVIARPAGTLSLELMSALTVFTRNNGVEIEPGPGQTESLRVTALGVVGGQDAALISVVPGAPFDGIALRLDAGVLSVLSTVNVFQACSTAVDGPGPTP